MAVKEFISVSSLHNHLTKTKNLLFTSTATGGKQLITDKAINNLRVMTSPLLDVRDMRKKLNIQVLACSGTNYKLKNVFQHPYDDRR